MGEGGITRVRVECANCHQEIHVNYGVPATIACQSCGSVHGYLYVVEGEGDAIALRCHLCKKIHPFVKNKKVELRCPDPKCHGGVLSISGSVELSKIKINVDEPNVLTKSQWEGQPSTEAELKEQYRTVPVEKSLKIVVKYYENNKLVERACRTWLYPEVVFALNEHGVIPPGCGVCHQFFSPRNSTQFTGGTKVKPFLRDLLQGLLDLFPNEDYYGLFNSDIVLPVGYNIYDLIPRYGKRVSFFHRLMVTGHPNAPARDLKKAYQEQWGKDGFVCDRETTKLIIEKFGDVLLGAPGWDDGLLVWIWEQYGYNSVDVRWGEIWHAVHDLAWSYNDPDGVWNFKAMKRPSGLQNLFDWEGYYKMYLSNVKNNPEPKVKTIGIIQPGHVGDIILCLPIAQYYYKKGYNVVWPVPNIYLPLFDYVDYVKPLDIGSEDAAYQNSLKILKNNCDEAIDLGIGFGRDETDWLTSKLTFDEWKYKEAKVPFEERYNLTIERNFKKEKELINKIIAKRGITNSDYVVTHDSGSFSHFNWSTYSGTPKDTAIVGVENIEGFTVFDWLGILEGAKELFLVDSCIATLVNQLGIQKQARTMRIWDDYRVDRKENVERSKLLTLTVAKDWNVFGEIITDINKVKRGVKK